MKRKLSIAFFLLLSVIFSACAFTRFDRSASDFHNLLIGLVDLALAIFFAYKAYDVND